MVLSDFPYWFLATVAVALGLSFGSFLNVVVHRLPRGQSLAYPGSQCPGCGKAIRGYDNIPVLSWLFLRGKARCCGTPISARYPLIELIGGLVGWALFDRIVAELPAETPWWIGASIFAAYLALALGLVAAIFIDLEYMLLPDSITIGGALLGLLTVPLRPLSLAESVIGACVGFLIVWLPFCKLYAWLRGHPGMGMGDAKLLMLTGAWFGWPGTLFALGAGAVQGTIVALVVFAARGRLDEPEAVRREREELQAELESLQGDERARMEAELAADPLATEPEPGLGKARLAFGPFLAIATLEYLFFGEIIESGYLWLLTGG